MTGEREQAVARLDMFEQVLPPLFAALAALSQRCTEVADGAGLTPQQWRELPFEQRERLIAQARRRWQR